MNAAAGRGAARTRKALSRLAVRDPAREGRRLPGGDDPAGEGALRRHLGQAGQPGLQTARGSSVHSTPDPQCRRRVADAGHVLAGPPLPVLFPPTWTPAAAPSTASTCAPARRWSSTPGTELISTPTRRCWHARAQASLFSTKLGVLRGLTRGVNRLRHRPGGRVCGHGPRCRWTGAVPRRAGGGHEPLRH